MPAAGGGAWDAVGAELDHWSAAGKRLRLWLRDDDAVEPTTQLNRLAALSGQFDAPILLAVIPMQATPALAARLAAAPRLRPCQHGYRHRNHAPPGGKAEFGPHRDLETMAAEVAAGWRRLHDLFGDRANPVFVPPWNRIDARLAARLPGLGLKGLSTIRTTPAAAPGVIAIDSDLDIIDWRGGRIGKAPARLLEELLALLQCKRADADEAPTLGVLMHHLVHDDAAWSFMHALLAALRRHPAVAVADPLDLFGCAAAAPGG